MQLLVTILALVLASEDAADQLVLATAQVAERIPLPPTRGPVSLDVSPLEGLIVIKAPRDAALIAARVAAHAGAVCPKVIGKSDSVELHCRSRRIDATLLHDRSGLQIELFELRGLPWRQGIDGPPRVSYLPAVFEPEETCAGGSSNLAQAECAYTLGHWVESARRYRQELNSRNRAIASLRLGDLALMAADPATAIGWYLRASIVGEYGRMAQARLCEMNLACFHERPSLDPDPSDMPDPLRNELVLRAARVEAFEGRFSRAVTGLAKAFEKYKDKSICADGGERTCRRIVLVALRTTTGTDSQAALELFLALPDREKGSLTVELAQAAAEVAARTGAPVFGANLMAAVASRVPADELADHLLRAAELYLVGRDYARARVIMEFAQSRFPRLMNSSGWGVVRRGMQGEDMDKGNDATAEAGNSSAAALAADLADAMAASLRARATLAENGVKVEPPAAAIPASLKTETKPETKERP